MENTRSRYSINALIFVLVLALFTLLVTVFSEGMGGGLVSTSFVKTLGKTLCLCLIAIAMDLVWGYCGILSLGHFAFFGLGGYMIGMWLMYEHTQYCRKLIGTSDNTADPARSDRRDRNPDIRGGRQ